MYNEIANPVHTETIADTKMSNEIYNAIMINCLGKVIKYFIIK